MYRRTRSLTKDSFVVDFSPSDPETLERVRQWLDAVPFVRDSAYRRENGYQPDHLAVPSDATLGHILFAPWDIPRSVGKGFVDALVAACALDSAAIRKRDVDDDWPKRPTRLVLKFSILPVESHGSERDFADLIYALIEAVGELGEGTPDPRLINTPLPSIDRAILQAIETMFGGGGVDLQWRSADFDVIASVAPTVRSGLIRLRLPRGVEPDPWVPHFIECSKRLLRTGAFGRPWSLSSVDCGDMSPGGHDVGVLRDWPLDWQRLDS